MFRKLVLSIAFLAAAALPLATSAEAAIGDGLLGAHVRTSAPIAEAAFVYGGQNYCWYSGGWKGAGWYQCGFAWRRGLGWGGGVGWNGWHGGVAWRGGVHGGYRGGHVNHYHGGYRGGHGHHGGNHVGHHRGGAHHGGGHHGGGHHGGGHRGGGHRGGGHGGGGRRR